jgi:hypothetical protein
VPINNSDIYYMYIRHQHRDKEKAWFMYGILARLKIYTVK